MFSKGVNRLSPDERAKYIAIMTNAFANMPGGPSGLSVMNRRKCVDVPIRDAIRAHLGHIVLKGVQGEANQATRNVFSQILLDLITNLSVESQRLVLPEHLVFVPAPSDEPPVFDVTGGEVIEQVADDGVLYTLRTVNAATLVDAMKDTTAFDVPLATEPPFSSEAFAEGDGATVLPSSKPKSKKKKKKNKSKKPTVPACQDEAVIENDVFGPLEMVASSTSTQAVVEAEGAEAEVTAIPDELEVVPVEPTSASPSQTSFNSSPIAVTAVSTASADSVKSTELGLSPPPAEIVSGPVTLTRCASAVSPTPTPMPLSDESLEAENIVFQPPLHQASPKPAAEQVPPIEDGAVLTSENVTSSSSISSPLPSEASLEPLSPATSLSEAEGPPPPLAGSTARPPAPDQLPPPRAAEVAPSATPLTPLAKFLLGLLKAPSVRCASPASIVAQRARAPTLVVSHQAPSVPRFSRSAQPVTRARLERTTAVSRPLPPSLPSRANTALEEETLADLLIASGLPRSIVPQPHPKPPVLALPPATAVPIFNPRFKYVTGYRGHFSCLCMSLVMLRRSRGYEDGTRVPPIDPNPQNLRSHGVTQLRELVASIALLGIQGKRYADVHLRYFAKNLAVAQRLIDSPIQTDVYGHVLHTIDVKLEKVEDLKRQCVQSYLAVGAARDHGVSPSSLGTGAEVGQSQQAAIAKLISRISLRASHLKEFRKRVERMQEKSFRDQLVGVHGVPRIVHLRNAAVLTLITAFGHR